MNKFVYYRTMLPARHCMLECGDRLVCMNCSGSEETLTTECNGGMLTPHEQDLIARRKLDYKQGQWQHLKESNYD